MNFLPALPDWLPWWVPTIVLILVLLWLLAFLLVPFSVIGLKSRLDGLEARLDEIQGEIRTLTLRLPDAARHVEFDDLYAAPPPEPVASPPRRATPFSRPPIPPAAHQIGEDHDESLPSPPPPSNVFRRPRRPPTRDDRTEPRLDWPR